MCSFQSEQKHICGCAIISSRWVITAAQCCQRSFEIAFYIIIENDSSLFDFNRLEIANMRIVVGTNNLESGNGTAYEVELAIPHQQFRERALQKPRYFYDVVLIFVKGRIMFDAKVKAVEFTSRYTMSRKDLTFTGWGSVRVSLS